MAEERLGESTVLENTLRALEDLANPGIPRWAKRRDGYLPGIESLPGIKVRIDAGNDRIDVVCGAIQSACEGLESDWKEAGLDHLGFSEDSPASRTERERRAAKHLDRFTTRQGPMSLKSYRAKANSGERGHTGRDYGERTFDSWASVTLTLVAEELIKQADGEPDASVRTGEGPSREAPRSRSRLGDGMRREIERLYQPIKPEDFKQSFFHRASTDVYMENLASLSAVTLYAGAAVSPDVSAPLSDRLMAFSLRERLGKKTDLPEEKRADIVGTLMHTFHPAYLGSITREFVRQHGRHDDLDRLEVEAQRVFTEDLDYGLSAGRDTGRFLALGLGALAFALRKAGKDPVEVITTSYDDRIVEGEPRVHEYFEDLKDCSFEPLSLDARGDSDPNSVPLYSLNGQIGAQGSTDPLIVGEADALTDHYAERGNLMERALAESSCIFVGVSLSEPDILSKLVNSEYQSHLPRYALVLAPDLRFDDPSDRARTLNLVAQRFLHLGVVPIIIDFPHQAPQFLIELSLRLQYGKSYRNYAKRLEQWWGDWASKFGFAANYGKAGGKRDAKLQEAWRKKLERVRETVVTKHLGLPTSRRDRDEQIQVEVWVRHPGERWLIHWATSEGMWLNSNTAHKCSIPSGEEFAVQRTFREGAPTHTPIDRPRGIWRYQLSIPLVLRKDPWRHLPVGVATVLSNKGAERRNEKGEIKEEGGKLAAFATPEDFDKRLAELTSTIRKPINELLDAGSDFCIKEKLGSSRRHR